MRMAQDKVGLRSLYWQGRMFGSLGGATVAAVLGIYSLTHGEFDTGVIMLGWRRGQPPGCARVCGACTVSGRIGHCGVDCLVRSLGGRSHDWRGTVVGLLGAWTLERVRIANPGSAGATMAAALF